MKTIVALYDTMEQARRALQALKDAGFNSSDISLVANNATGEYTRTNGGGDATATGATAGAVIGGLGGLLVGLGALVIPGIGPVLAAGPLAAGIGALVGAGVGAAAGGILGALVDAGIPETEAGYYAEGVRRGGALLTARVDDSRAAQVSSILQGFAPVNLNTRVAEWKKAGWTGYSTTAKPYTAEQIAAERKRYQTNLTGDLEKGGEVAIPVVEERLNIGKQEVQTGGTRVEKTVTERPVQADVTLRQEHVSVERRPADRPATAADAFKEAAIDVKTKAEQAVVSKEARVVEEVVVRKDVEQRTQQVQDKVRRTDVKVTETGGNGGSTAKNAFATRWQEHYNQNYRNTGQQFSFYEPAYTYGESLRSNKQYANWDWNRLEPEARRSWEQKYQTPWEKVKGAVRYAWENVKAAVS